MLKLATLELGFRAGMFRMAQLALRRRQAVILTFHRFAGEGHGHPRGLPIHRFEQYLDYLGERYHVVSLAELISDLMRGVVRPYRVALTVDDGYREVSTLAAPLLRRYGMPATFFVVSDLAQGRLWLWTDQFRFVFEHAPEGLFELSHRGTVRRIEIGNAGDRLRHAEAWREYAKHLPIAERDELLTALARACRVEIPVEPPDEYRAMTWAELRELAKDGFDIGAHTKTHPILSSLPAERLPAEIGECKQELERRLGVAVRHFAYPNGKRGDYTRAAVEAVAEAGYQAAVTAMSGGNTPATSLYELYRVDGGAEDLAHFAQAVSGFELAKLGTRARLGAIARPARWARGRGRPQEQAG
ncbi:MAG TPA: polysaccharide deacetylase family protein [Methylomirabilota bacterium]|jgi:peptidoglycan/xylan/chitin deacetylase (PgdA/CDA1 family)|nr:polysaccharide deacetylase family protein [Methylomirabilota bacterium]